MTVDAQIRILENVVERIDASISKLTEVSNSIGKLLAVHDERLNTLEKTYNRQDDDIRNLYSRIESTSREICSKLDEIETSLEGKIKDHAQNSEKLHKELKTDLDTKIKSIDDRLSILERWRWLIVGGATVIGYIANKLVSFL